MDHQYVDMYLRKKRGMVDAATGAVPPHSHHNASAAAAAAAAGAASGFAASFGHQQHHHQSLYGGGANMSGGEPSVVVDRQVDAVLRSAAGVQHFVDRADELSLQVETFEDKLTNLAKLVKLSQTLQDEKEADLRKQNHELKARLKRQEQVTYRLEKEVEALKAAQSSHTAVVARMEATEMRCAAIDQALSDFMSTYKDSCRHTSAQQTEMARGLKELAEAHEGARVGITSDLQGVKEWATRNLTRLKKHVDLMGSDLGALRESHLETTTQLQKVQAQTDNEHEKLLALLQQKSREANLLTEIVDKEIQSIHTMTQQHRAGLGHRLTTDQQQQSSNGATTVETATTSYATSSRNNNAVNASTTAEGGLAKKRSLYDELAFGK